MAFVFLIFADGGPEFKSAGERLVAQIKELDSNAICEVFDADRIAKEDPKNWKLHSRFMLANPRGFGYWLWKPWLHQILIERYPSDYIIYLDVGVDILINKKSKFRFLEYIELAKDPGVLIFQLASHPEWQYSSCKSIQAVAKSIGIERYPISLLAESQLSASVMIWPPGPIRGTIITKWLEIATSNNYENITGDLTEIHACNQKLIEHRHDQSILSLLVKYYTEVRITDESHSSIPSIKFPFWGIRNISGHTQLEIRRKRILKNQTYVSINKN